ncbi:MAG TPA: hypothetical protein VFN68_13085 [Acidimicrobiales bacterium]|nr:hypothetical protein [Acidimicrobiales bacterium]
MTAADATWPSSSEELVLLCSSEGARTPVPLGEARRAARETRARAEGRVDPGQAG